MTDKKTPQEERFDEIFEQELQKIKDEERRMTEKNKEENGPFNPTDEELRHDLITHISDSYKDVFGSRPRFFNWAEMTTEELWEKAEQVQEFVRKDIALERAQDKHYNERLEQAKETPGAMVTDNPDYDPSDREDEYNRPYNIYIPEQQEESVGNFLGNKFPSDLKEQFKEDNGNKNKKSNKNRGPSG